MNYLPAAFTPLLVTASLPLAPFAPTPNPTAINIACTSFLIVDISRALRTSLRIFENGLKDAQNPRTMTETPCKEKEKTGETSSHKFEAS